MEARAGGNPKALKPDDPIFWNPAAIDDSDLAAEAKEHEHGLMALAFMVIVAVLGCLAAGVAYVVWRFWSLIELPF